MHEEDMKRNEEEKLEPSTSEQQPPPLPVEGDEMEAEDLDDSQDTQNSREDTACEDTACEGTESSSYVLLKQQYDDLVSQREQEKEQFMLFRADTENLRRRLNREKTEALRYALEALFKEILPCLDSFEQALNQDRSLDAGALFQGVELVHKKLMDILGRHGLKRVEALSQEFDPNIHQAVRKEESEEVSSEVVSEVYQTGYYFHQRLLRAAVVSVLTPQESQESGPDL